jgi:hypothetical protein
MIFKDDIQTITISHEDLGLCISMAKKACIGGRSNIRMPGDRRRNLYCDNLIGQIGTMAGHLFLFGNSVGYVESRIRANSRPHEGDGGQDVQGMLIDFKTSLMRSSLDPLYYRLAVRPKEIHDGCRYILILVPPSRTGMSDHGMTVYVVGWANDAMLPKQTEITGPFKGAHILGSRDLLPMREFDLKDIVRHTSHGVAQA